MRMSGADVWQLLEPRGVDMKVSLNESKMESYTLVVSSADCWHQWGPVPDRHRPVDPPADSVSGPGFHSFAPPGRPCWPQRAGELWPGWCSQGPASSLWSPPTFYGLLGWALASLALAAGPPGKTGEMIWGNKGCNDGWTLEIPHYWFLCVSF